MRIALFLRNLDEEFQITVYQGIRARAWARGIQLVTVQGETIQSSGAIRPFALARQVAFDGILVLSSVIVDSTESTVSTRIPELLPDIPAVSVGIRIPGLPSVTIQTRRSLARVLEHLILDHGYRRLLYVGGPPGHRDNRIREGVFREVLERFRPTWPDLEGVVDHGGFTEAGGTEALRRHLDDRPFDAIVAANDNMALGILRLLKIQDNPAWRLCAVTGFDDTPQASHETPSLTSIHQPLDQLGALSLDLLADRISGRRVPSGRTIASSPVIRESCGCQIWQQDLTGVPRAPVPGAVLEGRLEDFRRAALLAERRLREGNYFGRDVSGVKDPEALWNRVDEFLANLGIREFFLVATPGAADGPTLGHLLYERRGGVRIPLPPGGVVRALEGLFEVNDTPPTDLSVLHLVSGQEALGLAAYAADDRDLPYVVAGVPHIANALKRLRTEAEQRDRAQRLEAEVQARTAELTRANGWLREEVALRTATEAEVRGQRRLLELMLRTLPIPILVFEKGSRSILYANPAFENRIQGQALFRPVSIFLDLPEDCAGVELELRSGQSDGAGVPVLVYSTGIDFSGKDATLAAMVDLSTQKALEAEVLQVSEFERRRFGLDLHDDICQRLAGVAMYIKGFVHRPPADPGPVFAEVVDLVDETLHRTRRYAHESFPIEVETQGLVVILPTLCETVALQNRCQCRFRAEAEARAVVLPAPLALNLYRIVQEALQNAVRHGKATSMEVALEAPAGALVLRVIDNGRGLAPDRRAPEGLGLRSMAYRASQLGGRFEITSRPEAGTEVRVEVPLARIVEAGGLIPGPSR